MKNIPDIISNLSISIIHYFYKRHDSSWQEKRTKFEYTLWCVRRGNIYIHINNKTFHAHAGDSVVFYPGKMYCAHSDEEGCEFMVVRFKLEMGNQLDLMNYINISGIVRCLTDENETFCQNLSTSLPDQGKNDLYRYRIFVDYITKFIEQQTLEDAILFYDCIESEPQPFIQSSIDYISANYRTATVKLAAAQCGLSENRFISNFKNNVGLSPGQYIMQCKMQEAARLLCDTDKKIAEISAYLGYSDQYSFSKAFKRYYGESPIPFRKSVMT